MFFGKDIGEEADVEVWISAWGLTEAGWATNLVVNGMNPSDLL